MVSCRGFSGLCRDGRIGYGLESVAQQGMSVSMGRSLFWLDEAAEAANYGPMALRMSLELVPRLGELPFEM